MEEAVEVWEMLLGLRWLLKSKGGKRVCGGQGDAVGVEMMAGYEVVLQSMRLWCSGSLG